MNITLIPANHYRRERWKNGFGWTREIFRHPVWGVEKSSEMWGWRLSIAEVDETGPFSAFQGCDRELLLLNGAGMCLKFDDGEQIQLIPSNRQHRFSGERALSAELINGPTQDFNAIWRRDRVAVTVLICALAELEPIEFFSEPAVRWVVYVISGYGVFKNSSSTVIRLDQGDSALIDPLVDPLIEVTSARATLEGCGEVVLVKIVELNG